MRRFASTFVIAVLLCAGAAIAQQASPETNPDHRSGQTSTQSSPAQTGTQSTVPNATQNQMNPQGGSPQSPLPGRVTGATPTQVQEALDRQLPANAQVTASVADDGSLKLTGIVRSEADKARAEQIAKEASNKTVNNQIQVKSGSAWNENPKK